MSQFNKRILKWKIVLLCLKCKVSDNARDNSSLVIAENVRDAFYKVQDI